MKKCFVWVLFLSVLVSSLCFVSNSEGAGAPAAESRELAIQLGAPFCDNAILQRDMEVPVWGWSKPGTRITVAFGGQKVTGNADENGKWVVTLQPLKASFEPREMVIEESGSKEQGAGGRVVLKNILVGEVWMASGQSNMQWVTGKSTANQLIEGLQEYCKAKGLSVNPIREFRVDSVMSQLHPIEKATGAWRDGDYENYSAIAFAFAEKLFREVNVPIAILNCSFSQTPIEAWVPREGWASAEDDFSKAIHMQCLKTDPTTPEHKQAWDAFYTSLENQIAVSEAAIKNDETPKAIVESVPGNMSSNRDANWMFNGLIGPVVPYAIRGAIWNQGYANMNDGITYYNNLHSLIRGWRIVWDRPELPVYFHQFYTHIRTLPDPSIGGAPEMRLGTAMARDIPHAGMASQIDISGGIHYRNKAVPGQRLALHALKNQYAKDVVAEGPFFASYQVKGDEVTVTFENAEGGLVVADTSFNRSKNNPEATGYADPKVIEDGEDKVKLFWLAGEDRVWHPATFEIQGEKVVVRSDAVPEPRGISYAASGVGFNPCLYNKALLPMTPFIQYDHKMVTQATWPDEKLKIAGETIDESEVGILYEYRKMPLLSIQFRDDAVFQADQPVVVWGSTRLWGEWLDEPVEGDCKVHFAFGPQDASEERLIKKVIDVTPEMDEWKVTLPPMKAGNKPYQLEVQFTIDGELAHERIVPGIVFGDVYCVIAPGAHGRRRGMKWDMPEVEPSGQIVRMMENESNRDGRPEASRFSICTSRTPYNRLAARWKDADRLPAAIGNKISAKTGRPVGLIWLQARRPIPLKNWVAPDFLKDYPGWMEDYKTVGSQYPNNPYYLENIRRYIAEWKGYWGDYIPEMMREKAVPEGAKWGAVWGHYPSPTPDIGDSTACFEYNVYVHGFTPASLKGIVFLSGVGMFEEDGANFADKMAVVAKSFKTRFGLVPNPKGGWKKGNHNIPFFYTIPSKEIVSNVSKPDIKGESTAVEISDWEDAFGILDALVK